MKNIAMDHNDAIRVLQEFVDQNVKQVAFVANFALLHVKQSGIILCARPELVQRLLGWDCKDDGFGGEFSLYLRHSRGLRKVALRMHDPLELVVQEIDEATEKATKEWRHHADENNESNPGADRQALERLSAIFSTHS